MAIKDNETGMGCWMFQCPIHGLETSVFCFRAADPKNKGGWSRGKLVFVETSNEERDEHFNSFTEKIF